MTHNFVNFSGGRSSGYMLYRLIEEFGGTLPYNYTTIFCNTGKEREETLRFVQECSDRWGVDVTWLEYRYDPERKGGKADPRESYVVVDFDTASRQGEPFSMMIDNRSFLPNPTMRICSQELKAKLVQKYARKNKIKDYLQFLGIRYDEPRRWSRILKRDDRPYMPLMEWKVTVRDVQDFWSKQNFDLGIPSEMGNCDLCFLKSNRNLIQTIQLNPERVEWWMEKEAQTLKARHRTKDPRNAQFHKETGIDCYCGD